MARHGDSKPWNVVIAFAWRGEHDRALDWLERAYAHRDPGMKYIRYIPLLKPLHGSPRFAALVRKLGLPDE